MGCLRIVLYSCDHLDGLPVHYMPVSTATVMHEKSNVALIMATIRYVASEIPVTDFAFFLQGARPQFWNAYM